jgi:hypothetical protein
MLKPLLGGGVHDRLRGRALRTEIDQAGKQNACIEKDAHR